jgi:hypothetical protein
VPAGCVRTAAHEHFVQRRDVFVVIRVDGLDLWHRVGAGVLAVESRLAESHAAMMEPMPPSILASHNALECEPGGVFCRFGGLIMKLVLIGLGLLATTVVYAACVFC